jgi:hypothetical protein
MSFRNDTRLLSGTTGRRARRIPARTLAITQNVTVDGPIELLGDWFDHRVTMGVNNSDLLEQLCWPHRDRIQP